ncbi:hypothetical protein F2Q69_00004844 [Brassica cretica]|uniref:Uncharacterized protein n=1 Tax=Brassica cretica TaxID=69181 RepID=A0A8S9P8W8_BRACR|nr:hypothetical protein F2Q69_00004844 [Brassica cretica]
MSVWEWEQTTLKMWNLKRCCHVKTGPDCQGFCHKGGSDESSEEGALPDLLLELLIFVGIKVVAWTAVHSRARQIPFPAASSGEIPSSRGMSFQTLIAKEQVKKRCSAVSCTLLLLSPVGRASLRMDQKNTCLFGDDLIDHTSFHQLISTYLGVLPDSCTLSIYIANLCFHITYDTNKDADFKLNWKRVAITSMFGLRFCWYGGLDKFIKLKLRYVPKSTPTGKNTSQVKEGLKRDFLPAIALEGGAWPLLQIANF